MIHYRHIISAYLYMIPSSSAYIQPDKKNVARPLSAISTQCVCVCLFATHYDGWDHFALTNHQAKLKTIKLPTSPLAHTFISSKVLWLAITQLRPQHPLKKIHSTLLWRALFRYLITAIPFRLLHPLPLYIYIVMNRSTTDCEFIPTFNFMLEVAWGGLRKFIH